ncbi:MAG: hypothetical protein KAZ87_13415 [Spirochaetes bacterium]|nr:hypothetical protein [Spirochaetota bacterium]
MPKNFESRLEHIEYSKSFKKMYRCKCCGQYWVIDEYDKYEPQIVIKENDVSNWKTKDYEEIRYELFAYSKGGYSDEKCSWNDCSNKSVKGKSLCPYHCFYNSNHSQNES